MVQLDLKSKAAALAFIFVLEVTGLSLSQEQIQLPAGQKNSNAVVETSGRIPIDDLKRWRTTAENAGDLTENAKKAVLSF